MDERLELALRAAIEFLEGQGYRYALIGGLALSQWGVIRATVDVDLKVLVPDIDYTVVRESIRSAFPTRARPHVPENPLIVAVVIHGTIVDFLLALPGYEQGIVRRAVRHDLGAFSVWVCSAEDLIVQKVVAGRGKDWPDVEALLVAQHGRLDQRYIDSWLAQFGEALENPALVAEYRQLRANVESLAKDLGSQ